MSREKPGRIRRFFGFISRVLGFIRTLFSLLVTLLIVLLLVDMFGGEVKPLPDKTLLTLVPSGVLVEQRSYADPMTQLLEQSSPYDAETPIRDLIDAIDAASGDARITGLVLDLNHLRGGGISKIEEVGAAITRFKQSGKPVLAYSDSYDQQQYLFASFADEIHLNPMGGVLITGFGYYGSYLKDAADKLKLNIHVFRAGKFKSAVEPFIRNDMSEESRENARSWLTELWQGYTRVVEQRRELTAGAVDSYVNNLHQSLAPLNGDLATLALDSHLVDHVSTRLEMLKRLQMLSELQTPYAPVDHKQYLTHHRLLGGESQTPAQNNIGVIVASGTILDGEQPDGAVGGDSLAALLQLARQDSSLKALVLRIDSPGGSAFASEIIRQELLETRKQFPVIISMGSVAASGGYWISANADEVWATPTTITGSIGVFGIVPTLENTLESLGIHSDGVGTTALADMNHLDRPMSPEASTVIQLSVDHIYQQFLDLVAEGRKLPPDSVATLAQGRVWTGAQAKDIGLVDNLGFFDDAVKAAAARAELSSWELKTISRPLSFHEQLLKQLADTSARISNALVSLRLPVAGLIPWQDQQRLKAFQGLLELNDPRDLYLQCFDCRSF